MRYSNWVLTYRAKVNFVIVSSSACMVIDPLGPPTVPAVSDHYFRTCCPPSVRLSHFSKQTSGENNDLYLWDWPRGSLMTHTCLVCIIAELSPLQMTPLEWTVTSYLSSCFLWKIQCYFWAWRCSFCWLAWLPRKAQGRQLYFHFCLHIQGCHILDNFLGSDSASPSEELKYLRLLQS